MSAAKPVLIDLGWCMARLNTRDNSLKIVSPDDASDSLYQPPTCVSIFGAEPLLALRDALNAAYPVSS
jgi:hypothetical protein